MDQKIPDIIKETETKIQNKAINRDLWRGSEQLINNEKNNYLKLEYNYEI
ncbi:MAG: hypothetical protein K2N51_08110 [Lachnospiraceae bacterium]|nr:hypothetical protein [Lachnospiraceae bacterium]